MPVVRDRPWYADPEPGIFMSQGVHNFDLMRWLAGSEARRVYARVNSYGDARHARTSAPSPSSSSPAARPANSGSAWNSPAATFPDSQFRSQVVGERGLLDFDGYTHLDMAVGRRTGSASGPSRRSTRWTRSTRCASNHSPARCRASSTAIREGRPPVVTGADGRAAVELCEAALLSGRTGQPVELPLAEYRVMSNE